MRKYQTGTLWCVWRWTEFYAYHITRLHVLKTPWFAICVHWLKCADPEPWLHDHPTSFLSIVLSGRYCEQREAPGKCHCGGHLRRWFNFVRAADRHKITWVGVHTVTLCLMGPKTREWGFHTDKGWIMWKDYYKAQIAESSNA